MSEGVDKPIVSEDGVIGEPVFSPDGQMVAFYVGPSDNVAAQRKGILKRIDVNGAKGVTLSRDVELPLGMSWTGDSIVLGQPSSGIIRLSDGGERRSLSSRLRPARSPRVRNSFPADEPSCSRLRTAPCPKPT